MVLLCISSYCLLGHIKLQYRLLSQQVILQWIPAHTRIHGNEVADQLGKEGSKKQQPKSKLSYQEAKTLIRNKRLADFKHRNRGYNSQQGTLRLLSRHQQTMIFQLRTGHCRLNSHMKRIGIKKVSPLPLWTGSTNHSPCPAVMPSPQKRKRNHLAIRKFPRKQTLWNSHRPTPDGAVHRPDGTTNITSLQLTLKNKKKQII